MLVMFTNLSLISHPQICYLTQAEQPKEQIGFHRKDLSSETEDQAESENLQASSTSYVCSAFTAKFAQTLILALQKPVLKWVHCGRSVLKC